MIVERHHSGASHSTVASVALEMEGSSMQHPGLPGTGFTIIVFSSENEDDLSFGGTKLLYVLVSGRALANLSLH